MPVRAHRLNWKMEVSCIQAIQVLTREIASRREECRHAHTLLLWIQSEGALIWISLVAPKIDRSRLSANPVVCRNASSKSTFIVKQAWMAALL